MSEIIEDDEPAPLNCIKCGCELQNISSKGKGQQPINGLAFSTYGHYGTTYFDPMNGDYLELSICDPCVREADEAGWVYHSRYEPPQQENKTRRAALTDGGE